MSKHRNTFEGGMLKDRSDSFAPPQTYSTALNAVHETENAANVGLTNEQSNRLSVDVGGEILGTTYIEQIRKSIIFVNDGGSSIHLFDHITETLEFVLSDAEFGCTWGFDTCEFMYAEVKEHNQCDDLYIYFSSDCKYYVVNITEMLDPVRKGIVLSCEECSYFELVHPICTPVINATPIRYAGTTLESGAVSFAVRLTDYDANYTNWFPISATSILPSENNLPGEPSNSAVKVTMSGLDPRYEYVEIAAIKTGGGVTTVSRLEKAAYSGGTYGFTYYGQKAYPMNLAEITTPTKIYLQGKDLIQHDGRLFFYNIKREKNINYQKYANQIGVQGAAFPVTLKEQVKYRFPSLQRGECYRFGIVWNYADGTHSKAFGIFGDAGNPNEAGAKAGVDPTYQFTQPTVDYDTTDAFVVSHPAIDENVESSALEGAIRADIANIDTNENNLKEAARQLDGEANPYCCGDTANVIPDVNSPTEATDAIGADIDDVSNMVQNVFENLSEATKDKELKDFTLNKNTSLKEAALELYDELVLNKESIERKAPTLTVSEITPRDVVVNQEKSNGRTRLDPWVDIAGRQITDEKIRSAAITSFEKSYSTVKFPNFKDCDGELMFPQGNAFCYKVPDASSFPHYDVNNSGVISNEQPINDPYSDVRVWLMGAKFSNIHIPTAEELPKPLCPTTPYSIVYVKRDDDNSTVIANGWTGGTELGYNNNEPYNFQRHGVNSRDNVFRGVNENGSRRTIGRSISAYTFHSPDTDFAQGRLDATKVKSQLTLNGASWKYGHFAKGTEPSDMWTGRRTDQRGTRIGNNLVGSKGSNAGEYAIKGISYTTNGTVTEPSADMQYKLDNVFNESSVYFEVDSIIPGNERDTSFIGDTLNHQGGGNCNSAYVSLVRELPDQYGGVENSAYIQLGIRGGYENGEIVTATEGICGDVFIGPYSKRRTSFVSEKVGNEWNVKSRAGIPFRVRSVCDQPDRLVYEILGLNINQTGFPEDSDDTDPRNYSGLYTTDGLGSRPLSHTEALAESGPLQDYYFPGTVTGVVYSIVEAKVCAWERTTGDPENDMIHAGKLKGFNLDSASSEIRPWERGYLNHVNYVPVVQPSRKQLAMIAGVRALIMLLIPAATLATIADIEGVFEAVATMFVSTGIGALFMTAAHALFTTDSLRKLFGLEPCYMDSEGASKYFKSERHKDNWNRYNWDYSKTTTETQYLGINSLYNTCDCDNCIGDDINQRGGETNKEIYHSAKQSLNSEIDAYRNIKVGAYNELPVHAGNIRKMFLQNNNMYVHSTKGIWMVQMAAGNWPADIGSQLTGVGDLLLRPTLMFDSGMGEGALGTNHPNASINVPGVGYFFVDDVARKVIQFNGQAIPISDAGMRKFFNNQIGFCKTGDCHDEVNAPKYLLGWDHKYSRLLFTKKDPNADASFTLSYTPSGGPMGKWISFHSYIPDFYFRDRYQMFSIDGSKIYKHNIKDEFQTFYGVKYPHFIEFTLTDQNSGLKYFEIENLSVLGEARNGMNKMIDKTFDEAIFWNYKDSTGLVNLNFVSDRFVHNRSQKKMAQDNADVINITRKQDRFVINHVRNRFNLMCDEFVNIDRGTSCTPIENVEHTIECLSSYSQDYDKRNFGGRYINVRLIYNDVDDSELVTHFIDWEDAEREDNKN